MRKQVDIDQFLKDVSSHGMETMLDSGLYRHLRFRAAKDSWNQWFEIVTWPGCLAINGDMGSWMFTQIDDMFQFFRTGVMNDSSMKINPSYWAEKIQSESRFGGTSKKFNIDRFRENVYSALEGYDLSPANLAKVKDQLEEDVFRYGDDEEVDAHHALQRFECEEVKVVGGDGKLFNFSISDPWEIDGDTWTTHFIWCLYAVVWAIKRYDHAQLSPAATKGGE